MRLIHDTMGDASARGQLARVTHNPMTQADMRVSYKEPGQISINFRNS